MLRRKQKQVYPQTQRSPDKDVVVTLSAAGIFTFGAARNVYVISIPVLYILYN